MHLEWLDWVLIVGYFVFAVWVGIRFQKRASSNIGEFFGAGKSLPWWIAGTSMVATTFAVDAPLAVTELVSKYGIAGNWFWWNFVMSGVLTTFVFAKLWNRANVLTDAEFITIRYSGKPAKILKIFRAAYLAIPINLIIMSWVTAAMGRVVSHTLNIDESIAIIFMVLIALFYSLLSGFWGVVITDIAQFIIAMLGSVSLAWISVSNVGGLDALVEKLPAQTLAFTPSVDNAWLPFFTFIVMITVQWWASWYPGAEPGGGGYVAQRIFSAKSEKDSLLASLWFNIAHYCVRPWPWILVALVSVVTVSADTLPVLSDGSPDYSVAYIRVMLQNLPIGVKGLVLASFFAAFMSTIDTHLNWGVSYLINDIYKPYIKPEEEPLHYVKAAKWGMVGLTLILIIVSQFIETISGAWEFLLALGAGTGMVYILRWFWYRINVWSEISAMLSALLFTFVHYTMKSNSASYQTFLNSLTESFSLNELGFTLLSITVLVTLVWITVTFVSSPEKKEILQGFCDRVKPGGYWGTEINGYHGALTSKLGLWLMSVALIYLILYGMGDLLLADFSQGIVEIIAGIVLFYFIHKKLANEGL